MKALILTLALSLGFLYLSYGQEEKKQSNEVIAYKAWVRTMDGDELKGILFHADSEGMLITDGFRSRTEELIKILPDNIKLIRLQREGAKLKGAIIGAAIGIGLALLLTKDVKGRPASFMVRALSRGEIVTNTVFSMASTGAIVGAKLSDKTAQFLINGNKFAYLNQLNKLKPYCFVHDRDEMTPEE